MICPRRGELGQEKAKDNTNDSGKDTCLYCGSLNEQRFLDALVAGAILGPTDKNYKVYVGGLRGAGGGKFYFQHLSIEGQAEFIRRSNEGLLNISYPGHFYTLPFFCQRISLDEVGQ